MPTVGNCMGHVIIARLRPRGTSVRTVPLGTVGTAAIKKEV